MVGRKCGDIPEALERGRDRFEDRPVQPGSHRQRQNRDLHGCRKDTMDSDCPVQNYGVVNDCCCAPRCWLTTVAPTMVAVCVAFQSVVVNRVVIGAWQSVHVGRASQFH